MNILTPTGDNSNTLYNETIGEHYHSKHGALQESRHVFIDAGLQFAATNSNTINVLEVGFGTGLNFLLSLEYCLLKGLKLNYTGLEAFPLDKAVIESLGYQGYVAPATWNIFIENYETARQQQTALSANCHLEIMEVKLQDFKSAPTFGLVYFDAFSVRHQPELWTAEIIAHTCNMLAPGGIFVTYAITGDLKRAVKACGFEIQKLPGAPGKREMLRAIKL